MSILHSLSMMLLAVAVSEVKWSAGFLPLMRRVFALRAKTSDSRMGRSFFADRFALYEESMAAVSTFLSRDGGGRVA